jgi:hypothetical protein
MGMGYAANYCDTTSQDFVKEQCPQEYENFIQALDNRDISVQEFSETWRDYSTKEEKTEHFKAYRVLCDTFRQKTGLELYLDYHNPDDGDRYDDVNGVLWCVDGVYELTKAGKKHQKQIQRVNWVSFG